MLIYETMDVVPKVFINFRGRDQAGYAALLDRELSERFGSDQIFLSSRSIRPGANFADEITRNLRLCEVVLVVIGPEWLAHGHTVDVACSAGTVDWVYHEIAEALDAGIRVIPVLVEDAAMPSASDLPPAIADLSSCQYLRLHHRNIPHDMARIVEEVAFLIRRPPTRRYSCQQGLCVERHIEVHRHLWPYHMGIISGTARRIEAAGDWVRETITEFSISSIVGYRGPDLGDLGQATVTSALRDAERLAAADRFVRRFLFPTLSPAAEAAPIATDLIGAAAEYLAVRPDSYLRVIYFLAYAHAELRAFENVVLATTKQLALPGPDGAPLRRPRAAIERHRGHSGSGPP